MVAVVAVAVVVLVALLGAPLGVKVVPLNSHVKLVYRHSTAIGAALTVVGGFVASFVAPRFSTCFAPDRVRQAPLDELRQQVP